ncbi:TIGR02221 family CRISPR-associated protein [Thermohalobacter berrensis]|uniref:CRISPR-associated protein n=1 Tax=Thermohalobacter berrensis TaxID=99594 RepID=A0A419SZC8_9FIRM|nr:TIGR02221 family CRISPR-associated protein [Thermohalobacter berrensis]RKD30498.1 CRISPR-associated protein [Thermohalobacter berrensis]
MGRKFLSFLGASPYKECCYVYDDGNNLDRVTTKYIQEALIKILCKDWNKDDKAIIFLTDFARKENYWNKEDETRRLKDKLLNLNISIKDISIPNGKNQDEIWEIFNTILNEIEEGDEIIFDLTHSFRSIPMLALVILNYAKVLKNVKLKGIYYGAYEARWTENSKEIAPIFNLITFDELLEWAQAVNSFTRYGNSRHLKELASRVLSSKLRERDQSAILVKNFVEKLDDFINTIYNCRGKGIFNEKNSDKKSISCAYKSMRKNLDNLIEDKNDTLKPLVPLFNKVKETTKDFEKGDNLTTGIAVIKWSIDNNLTQQAYTALDETIKTYVCVKFGLDETDKNNREEIVAKALRVRAQKIPKEKWKIKEEYRNKIEEIVVNLDNKLVQLSDKVNNLRNDINHFGYTVDVMDYKKLNSRIKNLYEEFRKHLEKE